MRSNEEKQYIPPLQIQHHNQAPKIAVALTLKTFIKELTYMRTKYVIFRKEVDINLFSSQSIPVMKAYPAENDKWLGNLHIQSMTDQNA